MLWLPVGNLKTGICSRSQTAAAAAAAAGRTPERLTLTHTSPGLGFTSARLPALDHSFVPAGLVTWLMSWWAATCDYHRLANYPAQLWAIILVMSQTGINRIGGGGGGSGAHFQGDNLKYKQKTRCWHLKERSFGGCSAIKSMFSVRRLTQPHQPNKSSLHQIIFPFYIQLAEI